jgi:hypothetical protein
VSEHEEHDTRRNLSAEIGELFTVLSRSTGRMSMKTTASVLTTFLFVTACASHTGVVAMGGNKFMVAKQQATGFPGLGNLKAEIISEASRHCIGTGKELNVLASTETQPPYILGNYPRAEIQFECVTPTTGLPAKP